jgi:hypothetical protein
VIVSTLGTSERSTTLPLTSHDRPKNCYKVVIQGLLIFGGPCTGADRPSTTTRVNDDENEDGFKRDKNWNESDPRA